MYICHQFYDNSMSWANSYVEAFFSEKDAKNEMYNSIISCISHCEKETMDRMIELLKTHTEWDSTIEETVDGFTIAYTEFEYEIRDNYEEDQYHFMILNTEEWELASQF
jgi:c-di-AMP phosphodiesterase-like protein